jgi:hypothetical protein
LQTNLGGTGNLTIDGAAQPLGATLTEKVGGVTRTPKAGIAGMQGATQKIEPGELEFDLLDNGGVSTDDLQSISSSTLLWENVNGKTCTYSGCMQIGEITTNPPEGTIKVKFSFMRRTEIPA